MFGRKPCLPIDITVGTNIAELKGNTSTKYYNQKVRCAQLKVDDKVFLKHTAFKGKHTFRIDGRMPSMKLLNNH